MPESTPPYPPLTSREQTGLDLEAATNASPPRVTEEASLCSRIWGRLSENVRPSMLVEIELTILTFCTGIQDAISFPDYHCFASNQTGNTVLLMVAALNPKLDGDMFVLRNIGAALGFFLLAAWITGQLGHLAEPRRRIWLLGCNLAQSGLVFGAAGLQWRGRRAGAGTGAGAGAANSAEAVIVTALLAFASGSQVVQSRALATTEISTAMATAAWVDLVIDPRLLAPRTENRPRNRRLGFLAALAAGSLAGAAIARSADDAQGYPTGSAVALLVSAAGKLLVTVMYLFNSADRPPMPPAAQKTGTGAPKEGQ